MGTMGLWEHVIAICRLALGMLSVVVYLLLAAWLFITLFVLDTMEPTQARERLRALGLTARTASWAIVRLVAGCIIGLANLGLGFWLLTEATSPAETQLTVFVLYLALLGVVVGLFWAPFWIAFHALSTRAEQYLTREERTGEAVSPVLPVHQSQPPDASYQPPEVEVKWKGANGHEG